LFIGPVTIDVDGMVREDGRRHVLAWRHYQGKYYADVRFRVDDLRSIWPADVRPEHDEPKATSSAAPARAEQKAPTGWASRPCSGWPEWTFDGGYLRREFVTNSGSVVDPDDETVELEQALVLIYDSEIAKEASLQPALKIALVSDRPLLIIAENVVGLALESIVINMQRAGLKVGLAKAPSFGDRRHVQLRDIAILTGGTVINRDLGMRLENVTLNMLGSAERVVIEKAKTTIIGGGAKQLTQTVAQRLWPRSESVKLGLPPFVIGGRSVVPSVAVQPGSLPLARPDGAPDEMGFAANAATAAPFTGEAFAKARNKLPLMIEWARQRYRDGLPPRDLILTEHRSEFGIIPGVSEHLVRQLLQELRPPHEKRGGAPAHRSRRPE
jgi:hypothetical protein